MQVRLEASLGDPIGNTEPRRVALDLTPGEESIIQAGEHEADRLKDDYLSTEHLLLGLLRGPNNELTALLAEQGVSAEPYERGIRALRAGKTPR